MDRSVFINTTRIMNHKQTPKAEKRHLRTKAKFTTNGLQSFRSGNKHESFHVAQSPKYTCDDDRRLSIVLWAAWYGLLELFGGQRSHHLTSQSQMSIHNEMMNKSNWHIRAGVAQNGNRTFMTVRSTIKQRDEYSNHHHKPGMIVIYHRSGASSGSRGPRWMEHENKLTCYRALTRSSGS